MTLAIWQQISPYFDEFKDNFARFNELPHRSFEQCQTRLSSSLARFVEKAGYNRVHIINSPDNSIYRRFIKEQLSSLTTKPVISSETLARQTLFSQIKASDGQLAVEVPGLLDKADGGFLILSPNWLISNPQDWPRLKAALLGEPISPLNCDSKEPLLHLPDKQYDVKLLIVGDREQLAMLEYIDADLQTGIATFSEVEQEFLISEQSIDHYLGYIQWLTHYFALPPLNCDALPVLLNAGTRSTEDHLYVPQCVMWLNSLLQDGALESKGNEITKDHLQAALDKRYFEASYLPERAISDIFDGHVVIETQGKKVGQVNGLTVIDVAGHPYAYGEPARISCVIHFGDGDISDVERKVELGGNLHAKGMMIMQAFVSAALNLDEPLPYSASIVFEQSYSEVDGDSASLAEVISFISALSNVSVDQQIALTGAVDQFGSVQAVGGLNEKVEGFFKVCKHQGLTGQQGVILPKSNLRNLTLNAEVVSAVKAGEFHVWPVETVDEAVPIIMGMPFSGEESIIEAIAQRIDELDADNRPLTLIQRLVTWLTRN